MHYATCWKSSDVLLGSLGASAAIRIHDPNLGYHIVPAFPAGQCWSLPIFDHIKSLHFGVSIILIPILMKGIRCISALGQQAFHLTIIQIKHMYIYSNPGKGRKVGTLEKKTSSCEICVHLLRCCYTVHWILFETDLRHTRDGHVTYADRLALSSHKRTNDLAFHQEKFQIRSQTQNNKKNSGRTKTA